MVRDDSPIHPDEVARRENEHAPIPDDFLDEGRSWNLTFSSLEGDRLDASQVLETAARTESGLRLRPGIVEGVVAQGERDSDIPEARGLAEAKAPDWGGGVAYHPRVAAPARQRELTRLSGDRRVRPNVVVGGDNRVVYHPSGYPWHCIGRVYVWNDASAAGWAWWGSGALISNRAILTAGHVVPWGAASWKAKFVPANYDGTSIYGTGFERWVTNAYGYDSSGSVTGYDAAVMRLQSPLSLGYFGSRGYSNSWNGSPYWTHCGYAAAVSGNRPNWQNGIVVHDTDSDSPGMEVEHDGDVTGGDSGGPLFAWWNDGPYIVGTHSGDETEWHFPFSFPRVNVDAGGNAMNNLVSWARANW